MVTQESEKLHGTDRKKLQEKQSKEITGYLTLALTYHPAINNVYQITRKFHEIDFKIIRLSRVLQSPPRVAFQNLKTLSL